jgi:hypothetical protein
MVGEPFPRVEAPNTAQQTPREGAEGSPTTGASPPLPSREGSPSVGPGGAASRTRWPCLGFIRRGYGIARCLERLPCDASVRPRLNPSEEAVPESVRVEARRVGARARSGATARFGAGFGAGAGARSVCCHGKALGLGRRGVRLTAGGGSSGASRGGSTTRGSRRHGPVTDARDGWGAPPTNAPEGGREQGHTGPLGVRSGGWGSGA